MQRLKWSSHVHWSSLGSELYIVEYVLPALRFKQLSEMGRVFFHWTQFGIVSQRGGMVVLGHGELTMEPSLNPDLDNSKFCTLCPMGLCLCTCDCYMMRRSSQTTQTIMSRNHGVYVNVTLPKVYVCVFFPVDFHGDQCCRQHTWENSAVDSTLISSMGFRGLVLLSRIQIFIGGRGQLPMAGLQVLGVP